MEMEAKGDIVLYMLQLWKAFKDMKEKNADN